MTAALEGGEWSAARPGRSLPPGKDPVPILQEAGWDPGPVGTGGKSLPQRDFLKYLLHFKQIHRNLTSLLLRVLVVPLPIPCHLALTLAQAHSSCLECFPLPTPCPTLTKSFAFLRLSPRERALSKVSTDSFPPTESCWPPSTASISRSVGNQYSPALIRVVAAAFGRIRDVLVSTVSPYVAVAARVGIGVVDNSRQECGAGPFEASAQFVPLSTTRWPFLRYIPSAGVRGSLVFHSVCSGPTPRA